MTEKDMRILSLMKEALPIMPEFEKGRMLGIVEGMAAMNRSPSALTRVQSVPELAARPGA